MPPSRNTPLLACGWFPSSSEPVVRTIDRPRSTRRASLPRSRYNGGPLPIPASILLITVARTSAEALTLRVVGIALGAYLAAVTFLAETAHAQQSPADRDADITFFESTVRPILIDRCFSCHGPEKQESELRLDSRDAALAGGVLGAAIEPGDPASSLLISAIRYGDVVQMPPDGRLPDQEVAALVDWVRRGAPWTARSPAPSSQPDADVSEAADGQESDFWAFQSPVRPPAPVVKNHEWIASPIDAFVLSRLERAGMSPAPAAGRHALLRRVTYDLLGVPPTSDELRAFLDDDSPDAFRRVVDRLLSSPHYGERWGRHWLDVARYADSNGMDENLAYGNAYRYRDYVIRAFNVDKPFDDFITEQLAGDLLPIENETQRIDALIATGFLAIGPKMLAEDDPVKMEMDIVDEQLDTVCRAIMGITIGCARCHDHKFDPISIEDYYALAGVFKSTKTMENFRVVARWREQSVANAELQSDYDDATRATEEAQRAEQQFRDRNDAALLDRERKRWPAYVRAGLKRNRWNAFLESSDPTVLAGDQGYLLEAEDFVEGNVNKDFTSYGTGIGVLVNRGELPNVARYEVILDAAERFRLLVRHAAAESRPVELLVNGVAVGPEIATEITGSWNPESQTWHSAATIDVSAGTNTVELRRAGPFPHIDKLLLIPNDVAEAHGLADDEGVIEHFVAGWSNYLAKYPPPFAVANRWLAAVLSAHALLDPQGPFALPESRAAIYPTVAYEQLVELQSRAQRAAAAVPELPHAMIVQDADGRDLAVHLRGSHLTLGETVPRRFPVVFQNAPALELEKRESGRLPLANWFTGVNHPLTARVIANRLWRWHFAEGIVRTPDNFGRLGDPPTHPQLLDWLARELIANDWSLKALHRQILLSNTYQMSSAYDPQAAAADPENRLHWRFTPRRLEAEALRDAILAVSGQLDKDAGGPAIKTENRKYVTGTASIDSTSYDSARRSVYLPVIRSALYPMFQVFDFSDPSTLNGDRATTTVAPQALFLMNSGTVQSASSRMAQQLLGRDSESDDERIRRLYEICLTRLPDADEIEASLRLIDEVKSELAASGTSVDERTVRAWESLCRVILASNEFIYVF